MRSETSLVWCHVSDQRARASACAPVRAVWSSECEREWKCEIEATRKLEGSCSWSQLRVRIYTYFVIVIGRETTNKYQSFLQRPGRFNVYYVIVATLVLV